MKLLTPAIPNLPWQDRSKTDDSVVWRFSENPVIPRRPFPGAVAIYNSAVVPFGDGFRGVFRTEYMDRMQRLHCGWSQDGISWEFDRQPIDLRSIPSEPEFEYAYDPRVVPFEDRFFLSWCNGYHGPTIGLAWTTDLQHFVQLENPVLPYNRNGILFPRRINGRYALLSRPSDTGHTPFGDIFYSESPDLQFWGNHRHVMSKGGRWWEEKKIGGGPPPIETTDGWLIFYHGVLGTCNELVYSMRAALLDRDQPWKVLARTPAPLLTPETDYETTGLVSNVIFPVTALGDGETGRIAIYYGGADTVTALAFCQVEDVLGAMEPA